MHRPDPTPASAPGPRSRGDRRARVVTTVVAAVLAVCAVSTAATTGTPATASPRPTPTTPTLPVPRDTVDPDLAVGGPKLASTGIVVDKPAAVPAPPAIKDMAWVLADLDTGEVLAARAPHARSRPASTLKVLTALTLLPELDPAQVVRATADDANADGSRVGLVAGSQYTVDQLFQGLMLASGNDAAYALSRAYGGKDATLAAMNETAQRLGAHDTRAGDPSGLDVTGQVTSAYDLALIGRAAMQLPAFRRLVATKQVAFPGRAVKGKRQTYMVQNHNLLLHNYPGTIGVKNGYTELSRRTFVSAVTRGGRTLVLTELYSLESGWRPQAAMYDWGFRYADQLTPVGRLVEPGTVTSSPSATAPAATPTAPSLTSAGAPAHAAPVALADEPVRSNRYAVTGGLAVLLLGLGTWVVGRRRRVVAERKERRGRHR